MPRSYKPDPRRKRYTKHTPQAISEALADHRRGMSFRSCSKKYGIPITVLCRRAKTPNMKTQGGQTALDRELEIYMARRIATCASLGFPLDNLDIRFLVKGYLDRRGVSIRRFRENLPSKDWVDSFVKLWLIEYVKTLSHHEHHCRLPLLKYIFPIFRSLLQTFHQPIS